jgi:hypothetical protein
VSGGWPCSSSSRPRPRMSTASSSSSSSSAVGCQKLSVFVPQTCPPVRAPSALPYPWLKRLGLIRLYIRRCGAFTVRVVSLLQLRKR